MTTHSPIGPQRFLRRTYERLYRVVAMAARATIDPRRTAGSRRVGLFLRESLRA
jgi:hypothetical protein